MPILLMLGAAWSDAIYMRPEVHAHAWLAAEHLAGLRWVLGAPYKQPASTNVGGASL
jgi:hypothetical protein